MDDASDPLLPDHPIDTPFLWRPLIQKVLFISVAILFLVFTLLGKYNTFKWQLDEAMYDDPLALTTTKEPYPGKYITHSIIACGGLGNMMWRFASISGISKVIDRHPFILSSEGCMHDAKKEVEGFFPEYAKRIHFIVRIEGVKGIKC